MRRLDHTMIFVPIAGSQTPFVLLVPHGALGAAIMSTAWSAVLVGVMFKLLWVDAPGWLVAGTCHRDRVDRGCCAPRAGAPSGILAVRTLGLGGVP